KGSREESFDPRSKWLDPVATAPGSVPNPLLSVAHQNKSLPEPGLVLERHDALLK
ncbi:MAG: hypothetical protein QOH42_214, partial [Blastocatellia bacterium]|nr:hypothetical protein [Blastocatellia bacterium]